MSLLSRLFRTAQRSPRLSTLVDRLATRSQHAVWQRVERRVGAMNVHEARGYIRARAAAVIERELGIVAAESPQLSRVQCVAIAEEARLRVVRRLLLENIRRQQASVIRQHRRAA